MFENDKINYAIIVIGDQTIEGECTYWNIVTAGTDHRKFMRMMPVYVRITAPLYW